MHTHKINFTPGPSQLYFTVEGHIKSAFKQGVPSISHRTRTFEGYYQHLVEGLRQLLAIPTSHQIFFCASATEIWERSIQNLVANKSFHLVNGAFSKRFFETAQSLKKDAVKVEVENGMGFRDVKVPPDTELIAITHNETSTGVSLPLDLIYSLQAQNPAALTVVDAVSSLPYVNIDYAKVDSVFFSVQKGFGLPAGLGVWIVNDRCLSKAEELQRKGQSIGSYHSLLSLQDHAIKNQTPETPNVLAIYLLGKVVEDFNRRGIKAIRSETDYKAATLYQSLTRHPLVQPFVTESGFQSRTVIVAQTNDQTQAISAKLGEKGMLPGDGYGAGKKTQLRFANFPTHSREQFELLADTLSAFG